MEVANHFLDWIKGPLYKLKHMGWRHWYEDQEPVSRQVTIPGGESSTNTLLNGQTTKSVIKIIIMHVD